MLDTLMQLIPEVLGVSTSYSDEKPTGCNDFGLVRFYLYKYDPDLQLYDAILLYQAGDRRMSNNSPNAMVLADQLESILQVRDSYPENCR